MGGLSIETVSPGVQFTPEAAAAFRRANAQVRQEFGRDIDVNSTYRSWDTQLGMHNAWNRYVNGTGPYPGHSKAVHPSESFHVSGLALDSDDWTNARIVAILADHGFIRNRLHVPNERHHFEYLWQRDNHRNDPAPSGSSIAKLLEDTMANPIIDVKTTLWIGRDDGTFEPYETWKAVNSRGIISKVFFGGTGADDLIPALSERDFEVAKTVWRQMCRGNK